MNDECQKMNPCSPNADCIDPSNTDGDLTCVCKPGFSGDGKQCVQTDPCATNPCGMGGTCTNDNKGGYTCACAAGTRKVGNKCGCDLSGTFAMQGSAIASWSNIELLEDGSVPVTSWALFNMSYDPDGNLKVEITECGGSSYDLCDVPVRPLLGPEAYGQWTPPTIWGTPSMPRTVITVPLPDSQLGAAFKTGMFAMVDGLQLDDPMGAFPKTRKEVAGAPESSGTPTNGAKWIDPDNDGALAMTTYAVGPGGEKLNGPPDPPAEYPALSPACPRSSGGERAPYAYPPATSGGLNITRVKRVFSGQRILLDYDGKVDSCDTISGAVKGPDNGEALIETRVAGCVRVNGDGESACQASVVDFLDGQAVAQKTSDSKFKMKRVPATATCADAIAMKYE
jgi:hypothetical protein